LNRCCPSPHAALPSASFKLIECARSSEGFELVMKRWRMKIQAPVDLPTMQMKEKF